MLNCAQNRSRVLITLRIYLGSNRKLMLNFLMSSYLALAQPHPPLWGSCPQPIKLQGVLLVHRKRSRSLSIDKFCEKVRAFTGYYIRPPISTHPPNWGWSHQTLTKNLYGDCFANGARSFSTDEFFKIWRALLEYKIRPRNSTPSKN